MIAGDADATKRYLTFLGSGGSKYPIDLLKDAGVDMTTDEPLDLTMQTMNRVMDEMEEILRSVVVAESVKSCHYNCRPATYGHGPAVDDLIDTRCSNAAAHACRSRRSSVPL